MPVATDSAMTLAARACGVPCCAHLDVSLAFSAVCAAVQFSPFTLKWSLHVCFVLCIERCTLQLSNCACARGYQNTAASLSTQTLKLEVAVTACNTYMNPSAAYTFT